MSIVVVGNALTEPVANAVEWKCPSKTDIPYVVQDETMLSQVAQKTYCVTTEPSLSNVWHGLHQYNKFAVGEEPIVYKDLVLCLPEHFTGINWYANRCVSDEAPSCGNGKREEGEVCDGADIGPVNCEALRQGSGTVTCRADCKAFELAACAPVVIGEDIHPKKPEVEPPINKTAWTREKAPPPRRPWSADIAIGSTIPLQTDTWKHLHRPLGNVRIGARFDVGWFQLAPRVHFLGGRHDITYNEVTQDQTFLGGGCTLEWGVPLRFGAVRITPGVSTGVLYLQRSWMPQDFPFGRPEERQSGLVPVAGVFVRPEWQLRRDSRWRVMVDVGGDVMLYELVGEGVQANLVAKIMGGVGHVF